MFAKFSPKSIQRFIERVLIYSGGVFFNKENGPNLILGKMSAQIYRYLYNPLKVKCCFTYILYVNVYAPRLFLGICGSVKNL